MISWDRNRHRHDLMEAAAALGISSQATLDAWIAGAATRAEKAQRIAMFAGVSFPDEPGGTDVKMRDRAR